MQPLKEMQIVMKLFMILLMLMMVYPACAEISPTLGPRTYEQGMRLIAEPRDASAADSVTAITAAYLICDHTMLTVGEETNWSLILEGQSPDAYTYDFFLWHQELTDTSNMYYSNNYFLDVTDTSFTAAPDATGRYFVSVTVKDQYGGQLEVQSAIYIADETTSLAEKVAEVVALCRTSGSTSDYDVALFMHDYLINNACYDETYTYYFPEGVLLYGTGVCQSYALAYQILLEEMGVECLYVTGVAGGVDHAWNLVDISGQWYQVDCTWDDPIMVDETGTVVPGGERHDYFCISDEKIAADHTWDRALYPECAMDYGMEAGKEYIANGVCGDNIRWTLDTNGLLEMKGSGAMYDFFTDTDVPWYAYLDKIVTVSIENGITTVGGLSFRNCTALRTASLPDTLVSLGYSAFCGCKQLEAIELPEKLAFIGDNAFSLCHAMTELAIPAGVTSIADNAFANCSADLVLTVYSNSYAHTWCEENGQAYVLLCSIHNWAPGVIITAQTCTTDGEMQYICTVCSETRTEPIPPHFWHGGRLTTTSQGSQMAYACRLCGETKTASVVPGESGDVNGDGLMDMLDIIDLMEWYCDGLVELNLVNADVNDDDALDMLDILVMMNWFCGEKA